MDAGKNTLISLVLPVFNEEENLPKFYDDLCAVIDPLHNYSFELIFVNDGSSDTSGNILQSLQESDSRIRFLSFTRNFGHQAALVCGLKHSIGDAVITMDSDLQHPPEMIPELLKKWKEGFDVVNTIRKDSDTTATTKKWSSRLFYKLFNHLSDVKISEASADFRLISREVANVFKKELKEKNMFLRGLVAWVGFKQATLSYTAQPRHSGKTKFTPKKMFSFANSGISYFTLIPIKLGLYLGLMLFALSFMYLLGSIIYGMFTGTLVRGWTSLLFVFLLISSIQFIFIGIIGIYIGHIFNEVKNRPMYIVESSSGFEKKPHA